MTESSPAALSIGAVLGDSDVNSMTWKREINALSRDVQVARAAVVSPVKLNVVYHVDGKLVPNDFEGVRTGRFDKRKNHLMVQAAVPDEPVDDRRALLLTLLRQSVDEAERFAQDNDLASQLTEIRGLLGRLGSAS